MVSLRGQVWVQESFVMVKQPRFNFVTQASKCYLIKGALPCGHVHSELGRPWALEPWPSPSQRWCWLFLVFSWGRIQGHTQHSRWVTQWESLLKLKYIPQILEQATRREHCAPWGLGFYPLLTLANYRVEYSLLGEEFLGSRVLAFSSLFGQEFLVLAPTNLGLYGLIWLLVECCRDRALTFLIAGHEFLIAGLHVFC